MEARQMMASFFVSIFDLDYRSVYIYSRRGEKRYTSSMDEVTIGDKTYISSKRAAELTGYAKDYVGQLCREGHVDAKMVGRGWYVYEPSIMRHRFGDPQEVAVPELPQQFTEESKPAVSTWDPPVYKAETPVYMAEIKVPEESRQAEEDTTLTDMQAAWREWFDKKEAAIREHLDQAQVAAKELRD